MKALLPLFALLFAILVGFACLIGLYEIFRKVDVLPLWLKIPIGIIFFAISYFAGKATFYEAIKPHNSEDD